MVELLTALQQMLGEARQRAGAAGPGGGALQQLVLILADGRFHEKEALRRAVQVSILGCFNESVILVVFGFSLEAPGLEPSHNLCSSGAASASKI